MRISDWSSDVCSSDLLAQRSGDLYRIVGRRSRFCKPFGLRISLDELEAALARKGIMAAVTGNDDVIAIACRGKPDDSVISEIARNFQLPVSLFDISATDEWPRLPSGKTDYQAILQADRKSTRLNTSQ